MQQKFFKVYNNGAQGKDVEMMPKHLFILLLGRQISMYSHISFPYRNTVVYVNILVSVVLTVTTAHRNSNLFAAFHCGLKLE